MGNSGEKKKTNMNQLAIIISTVVGFAIGIVFSIQTNHAYIFVIFGVFAFVEAIVLKITFRA